MSEAPLLLCGVYVDMWDCMCGGGRERARERGRGGGGGGGGRNNNNPSSKPLDKHSTQHQNHSTSTAHQSIDTRRRYSQQYPSEKIIGVGFIRRSPFRLLKF